MFNFPLSSLPSICPVPRLSLSLCSRSSDPCLRHGCIIVLLLTPWFFRTGLPTPIATILDYTLSDFVLHRWPWHVLRQGIDIVRRFYSCRPSVSVHRPVWTRRFPSGVRVCLQRYQFVLGLGTSNPGFYQLWVKSLMKLYPSYTP